MTAVVDASVLAAYLLSIETEPDIGFLLGTHSGYLHMPHLGVIETASVIRRLARGKIINHNRADAAIQDLATFPTKLWPHEFLLQRVWQLRDNMSAYDATYVALAESLDAVLITQDRRLAKAAREHAPCSIVVVKQVQ